MKGCGSGFFVRERENAQRESRSERGLGERREKKKSENEVLFTVHIILF